MGGSLSQSLRLVVSGDARGATRALSGLGSEFRRSGDKGAAFGAFVRRGALSAAMALGAMAAAGVKALYEIGAAWDSAFDAIRIGTGATGAALKTLTADAKAVAMDTASSLGDVGAVVASLNTRLGLTGRPLQALSKQFLDFSRLTGGNVQQDVRLLTRLFGDWGVETKNYGRTLDKVFRTLQASDISMSDLTGTVVQYGSTLRQLGFDLDESLAMLGKWEKEGVTVTTALTGLRFALKTFANAGRDPKQAFRETFNAIIKADSAVDAMTAGIKVFGTRAAPDMVAAIREGRFAWEDMEKYITNGADTVKAAADDTDSLAESWQKLKNRLAVKFEPAATRIFDRMSGVMERFGDWASRNADPIARKVEGIFAGFARFMRQNGPSMISAVKTLSGALAWFLQHGEAAGAALAAVFVVAGGPLAKIVAGITLIESFRRSLEKAAGVKEQSALDKMLDKKYASAWAGHLFKGGRDMAPNVAKVQEAIRIDPATIKSLQDAQQALSTLSETRIRVKELKANNILSAAEANQVLAHIDKLESGARDKFTDLALSADRKGKEGARKLALPFNRLRLLVPPPKIEDPTGNAQRARQLMQAVFTNNPIIAFIRRISTSGDERRNADGSIIRRPTLTWVAEAGYPEVIIPLDPSKRGRAQSLLQQSGLSAPSGNVVLNLDLRNSVIAGIDDLTGYIGAALQMAGDAASAAAARG